MLLEGHCFEATTGSPPRGLQITLGTERQPVKVDTIVMANLGYFQLKANPGAWLLRLRQGRSAEIYDIVRLVPAFFFTLDYVNCVFDLATTEATHQRILPTLKYLLVL